MEIEQFICDKADVCKRDCSHKEPHDRDEYCDDICSDIGFVECIKVILC